MYTIEEVGVQESLPVGKRKRDITTTIDAVSLSGSGTGLGVDEPDPRQRRFSHDTGVSDVGLNYPVALGNN